MHWDIYLYGMSFDLLLHNQKRIGNMECFLSPYYLASIQSTTPLSAFVSSFPSCSLVQQDSLTNLLQKKLIYFKRKATHIVA